MTGQIRLWLGGAILLAGIFSASSAHAQYGIGGLGLGGGMSSGWGVGYYNYSGGYGGGGYQRPPYYALYPPVYYSHPVARPYGYSPFAYPPGVMTPDVPQNKIEASPIIYNPFVQPKSEPKSSPDKAASRGRTYLNPFVQQASAR